MSEIQQSDQKTQVEETQKTTETIAPEKVTLVEEGQESDQKTQESEIKRDTVDKSTIDNSTDTSELIKRIESLEKILKDNKIAERTGSKVGAQSASNSGGPIGDYFDKKYGKNK